ncbi:MAG: MT-A70 family methyltransferase [Bradymonadaceae bacterium]
MTDQPPLIGPDRDIRTVVIDPPWDCESGGGQIKRGADAHYPLLSAEDTVHVIQAECEPWQRLADSAHLYLWTTNRALALGDAHTVCEGLGFRPVTVLTWVKDRIGLGQYFRGQTEQILFGVRGETQLTDGTHSTLIEAPRGEHSAKPEASYEMIEEASPGAYLDIFARRQREGWDVWGNEV